MRELEAELNMEQNRIMVVARQGAATQVDVELGLRACSGI